MARQKELLAAALSAAKLSSRSGIVRSADLERGARERLVHAGYLEEVLRGWYLLTTPSGKGTTSLWFSGFWAFMEQYLKDRFGDDYCLSAESSVELHCGQTTSPRQLQVLTKQASNSVVQLLHGSSLVLTTETNFSLEIERVAGVNVMPLARAICRLSPGYFARSSLDVEIAFKLVGSVSELSRILLESGSVSAANRIAGVFEKMGESEKAERIVKDMAAAGYGVKPSDPFGARTLYLRDSPRLKSPYVGRIEAMWKKMREDIVPIFPTPGKKIDKRGTLKVIERLNAQDAYHSLFIEGYQVTEEMIERIAAGQWSPEIEIRDDEQRNAMAAKGYLQAFQAVRGSVERSLKGKDASVILEADLQDWYRELFAPSMQAGLLKPAQLAGYRNNPVYIQGSRHVPLPVGALVDSMEKFFELLAEEKNPAVRAVLGHFIFVFIHPYVDGNGRIGRFIMNLMLVAGGYPWTVIRSSERTGYIAALEEASVRGNIKPFAEFVAAEMISWKGEMRKILADRR